MNRTTEKILTQRRTRHFFFWNTP